jgi:hypothetical protein
MSIGEYLLLESFEVGSKEPQKLTPSAVKDMLKVYLYPKYGDRYHDVMTNMLSDYDGAYWFKETIGESTYFVVFGKPKGSKYFEVHFSDIDKIDTFDNTGGKESQSLKVFSYVFKVLYWYGLVKGKDVKLQSLPSEDRSSFYKKIFDKVVKDYKLDYSVKIEGHSLLCINNKTIRETTLMFTERFDRRSAE